MIEYIIPLLSCFADGAFQYFILPILCLAVLVVIPQIVRYIIGFRR